jgi:hypothetical protein
MPFKSVIDARQHLVVTTAIGDLTGDEGLACCLHLKARADFDPAFDQLLDFTHATRFDATAVQLRTIAAQPLFSPASRRAIVATNPAIFGLARMFEAYRSISDVGERIMVFDAINKALEWLDRTEYTIDRRLHPRRELEVEVSVRTDRELLPGRTLDISESGVSALLPVELHEGDEVEMHISLPGNPVTVRAIVRHRNVFRHGFEFVQPLCGPVM